MNKTVAIDRRRLAANPRPRGVKINHISLFKDSPERGLPQEAERLSLKNPGTAGPAEGLRCAGRPRPQCTLAAAS